MIKTLNERADEMLARLKGSIVMLPIGTLLCDCVIVLREGGTPHVIDRGAVGSALNAIGLIVPDLHSVLAVIATDPRDDGWHYPVILLVEKQLAVTFIEAPPLSRGGNA